MVETAPPIGRLLKDWRTRRRRSQLDLAYDAEVSARHLSFVETGRAAPSRDMVLRLAEQLEVPLRDRNALLIAAGFAPIYPQRALDDPALSAAKRAIEQLIRSHEPFPAFAIDRHWTMVAANRSAEGLLSGAASKLLEPPVNVLRVALHPEGVSSRILNLAQVRRHTISRLRHLIAVSADPVLEVLLTEILSYPEPPDQGAAPHEPNEVFIPFRISTELGTLSFFSTTTVIGSPMDITLSEIAIESFFPADEETGRILKQL